MALICQTVGITNSSTMTDTALDLGSLGYIICYSISFVCLGIPLMYMEMIVGQFTARSCLDAWRIRPCFVYFGYIQLIWQVILILHNFMILIYLAQYLILSFEHVIPFYKCGEWSNRSCGLLQTNYTAIQACVTGLNKLDQCQNIENTFPEYYYWRKTLLKLHLDTISINYKLLIPAFLLCIFIYICCFKRRQSLELFIPLLTIYPYLGYIVLLIGTMLQEGSMSNYSVVMDTSFEHFNDHYRLTLTVLHMVQAMGLGSGIMINWSSTTPFRSPTFSYVVITIVFSVTFTILCISTTAMMICPQIHKIHLSHVTFTKASMSMLHEKVPRLIHSFENPTVWLIIYYSSNVILGARVIILYFFSLLELIYLKFEKVAKYPGLTTFVGVLVMFLLSIPLLTTHAYPFVSGVHRRFVGLSSVFVCAVEYGVFLLWYGLDRIAEDVHFMQGIKPNIYFKIVWLFSIWVMIIVFFHEYLHQNIRRTHSTSVSIGLILLDIYITVCILTVVIQLIIGACKRKVKHYIKLDPTWGPSSEILRRSRAMFSAQAMTKEYMYRQYQLQAGIIKRQKKSNIRLGRNVNERTLTRR